MEIPFDVLQRLPGGFTPPGLNDDCRRDLSQVPFWAVDSHDALEIDDAFAISAKRAGGFVVQVAIADAGQLHAEPHIIAEALQRGQSRYGLKHSKRAFTPMLPYHIFTQLELRDTAKQHRATVVRTEIDESGKLQGDAEVFPALVRAHPMTPHDFARQIQNRPDLEPIKRFLQEVPLPVSAELQKDIIPIGSAAIRIGAAVVAFSMITANLAVAKWLDERTVAAPFRTYDQKTLSFQATSAPHQHFSDGHQPYVRFTSPLRQADGLIAHIQISTHLANGGAGALFGHTEVDRMLLSLNCNALRY